jgi:hypothetical protein
LANYDNSDYTKEAAGRKQVTTPDHAGSVMCLMRTVAVDTALALNDVLRFGYLPRGATIVDAKLICDDLDSAGPTITINIGDAAVPARIFAASVAGGTGAVDNHPVNSALGFQYTAKTLIQGVIAAAATTKVAGNVTLVILFTMDGQAVS